MIFRADTRAGILDIYPNGIFLLGGPQGDDAFCRREFVGIAHQVGQHLGNLITIAKHIRKRLGHLQVKLLMAEETLRDEIMVTLFQQIGQVHARAMELFPPGLNPPQVEDIINQPGQSFAIPEDGLQALLLLVGYRPGDAVID